MVNTIDSALFSKLLYNWSKIITHSEVALNLPLLNVDKRLWQFIINVGG